MKPDTRISKARTRLLLDHPWFGSLAMRLHVEATDQHPTFATDGTRLLYNPEFLDKLNDSELCGVIAHEVMHCALLHPFRQGSRDHKQWNQATDYAINSELVKAGITLPKDALCDSKFDGLPAEVIYSQLGNNPNPQPAPDLSTGEVMPAPSPEPGTGASGDVPAMTESDWKVATEQASDVAKGCGKLPGDADRAMRQARKNVADWRTLLREFIAHTVPSDYSWASPNRRHIHAGLYLPGITKENTGAIAIAVDTSGSISPELLSAFASEINSIAQETHPESIVVIYCDSEVRKVDTFPQDAEVKLQAHGGGGTMFQPVFNEVKNWEEQPACLIYFTDLEAYDDYTAPDYPVMWCTPLSVTQEGKFGTTARITTN